MSKGLAVIALALVLTACSSVSSIHQPADGIGLNYYMPNKDFLITVTVDKKEIKSITFGTTNAYPDTSQQYLLNHAGNLFGKNTLNVTIDGSGLLGTAKAKTDSQVTEALTGLGSSIGAIVPLTSSPEATDDEKKNTCTTDGDHKFIFTAPDDLKPAPPIIEKVCDIIDLKIVRVGIEENKEIKLASHHFDPQQQKSGYFYRQLFPYKITASGKINASGIVFTPSPSPTYFLPVSKTFFSDNNAEVIFSDGVPTGYLQDTDGELVSLFKLPADILGAYFKALGETLSSLQANNNKEQELLVSKLNLKIAKEKYRTCVSLLKTKNEELFNELECNK